MDSSYLLSFVSFLLCLGPRFIGTLSNVVYGILRLYLIEKIKLYNKSNKKKYKTSGNYIAAMMFPRFKVSISPGLMVFNMNLMIMCCEIFNSVWQHLASLLNNELSRLLALEAGHLTASIQSAVMRCDLP